MESQDWFKEGDIICSRFKVEKKIGEGSFGQIYLAKDIVVNCNYAIKLEKNRVGKTANIQSEMEIMTRLQKLDGFPKIIFIGKEKDFKVLVMTLLGRNLQMLFKACNEKFSVPTLFKIAHDGLSRLESLHSLGIIHRDMKPENFVESFEENEEQKIYLLDFGLAKPYKTKSGEHIKKSTGYGIIGTVRYVSINCHRGVEQSRRDDLLSFGYVLVYLCTASLPWMNLAIKSKKDKKAKIFEIKRKTSLAALTHACPKEIFEFMKNVSELRFKQDPDYVKLKSIFLPKTQIENFIFDWKKPDFDCSKTKVWFFIQQTNDANSKAISSFDFEEEESIVYIHSIRKFPICRNPFQRLHDSFVDEKSENYDPPSLFFCSELNSKEIVNKRYNPISLSYKGITN